MVIKGVPTSVRRATWSRMKKSFKKILEGYRTFRDKYFSENKSVMQYLSDYGQKPQIMMVACCDSRVDPALMLQCDPGDLFVVRNVANIIPPCESDDSHHGTSAALEFGVCYLKVKHLIILGHSQCGGIQALLENTKQISNQDNFISNWVSIINPDGFDVDDIDDCAQKALTQSYDNCLSFPWLKEAVEQEKLIIHLWFFDIKTGEIFNYSAEQKKYLPLDASNF